MGGEVRRKKKRWGASPITPQRRLSSRRGHKYGNRLEATVKGQDKILPTRQQAVDVARRPPPVGAAWAGLDCTPNHSGIPAPREGIMARVKLNDLLAAAVDPSLI